MPVLEKQPRALHHEWPCEVVRRSLTAELWFAQRDRRSVSLCPSAVANSGWKREVDLGPRWVSQILSRIRDHADDRDVRLSAWRPKELADRVLMGCEEFFYPGFVDNHSGLRAGCVFRGKMTALDQRQTDRCIVSGGDRSRFRRPSRGPVDQEVGLPTAWSRQIHIREREADQ